MSVLENLLNNTNDVNMENNMGLVQKFFLETNIGKVVNDGLDTGIRALMPNSVEDDIIDIKDSFIGEGFSEGVRTAINKATELGQNALGLITGKFDTLDEIKEALSAGGLTDKISDVLDFTIDKVEEHGLLSSNVCEVIRTGKNIILNAISAGVDNELTEQVKSLGDLEQNIEKWSESYNKQDFKSMEKYYSKIENELSDITPLQDVLEKAEQLQNIHNLIKNNGQNFDLSKEELELANKLF